MNKEVNMDAKQKSRELGRLWCKWNRKEISGDDFAEAFFKLYKKDVLEIWNDPLEKLIV